MLSIINTFLFFTTSLVPVPNAQLVNQEQKIVVQSDFQSIYVSETITPEMALSESYSTTITNGSDIVAIAKSFIGSPYVYGGDTPAGFDCSGFTMYVFGKAGISLPHSASAQAQMGVAISQEEALPGDLVYWGSHVGIWVSPGLMIDSAEVGTTVSVRPIWGSPVIIRLT